MVLAERLRTTRAILRLGLLLVTMWARLDLARSEDTIPAWPAEREKLIKAHTRWRAAFDSIRLVWDDIYNSNDPLYVEAGKQGFDLRLRHEQAYDHGNRSRELTYHTENQRITAFHLFRSDDGKHAYNATYDSPTVDFRNPKEVTIYPVKHYPRQLAVGSGTAQDVDRIFTGLYWPTHNMWLHELIEADQFALEAIDASNGQRLITLNALHASDNDARVVLDSTRGYLPVEVHGDLHFTVTEFREVAPDFWMPWKGEFHGDSILRGCDMQSVELNPKLPIDFFQAPIGPNTKVIDTEKEAEAENAKRRAAPLGVGLHWLGVALAVGFVILALVTVAQILGVRRRRQRPDEARE